MTAGTYNMTCEKGTTFGRTITWTDSNGAAINITGYTVRMKVKTDYGGTLILSLLTTGDSPAIVLTTPASGIFTITLTATVTAALTAGTYIYDLEMVSGAGVVTRIIEGTFTVKNEVTD